MFNTSRRDFIKAAGAGTAAMMAGGLPKSILADGNDTDKGSIQPNVIVCMVDDMGFSDPGCFGGEIDTPNLDKLAANGVRFTNFHNTSRCCPSRASILTGLYPHQTGVGYMTKDTGHPGYRGGMKNPCVTMAEVVGSDYATSICGKWHLTPDPREVGFQTADNWFAWGATSFFFPFDKDGVPSKQTDPSFYATDFFADGVVNHIKASSGKKPFLVYWTPTAPHYPIHAKEEDVKKYRELYAKMTPTEIAEARYKKLIEMGMFNADNPWSVPDIVKEEMNPDWFADYRLDTNPLGQEAGFKKSHWKTMRYDPYGNTSDLVEIMSMYAAMMDRFDQGLGRVLKTLEETGEYENTLIMFCSDNGCSGERLNIGPRLSHASCTPFLKTKKSAYQGGIGTPLIMHWPAQTTEKAKGSINRTFGHLIDVMPTVLSAAGMSYPKVDRFAKPIPKMEGRSLLPALKGEKVELNAPIFIEHGGNAALITEEWKLTSDTTRDENNKKISGPWCLYDMKKDRFERNDVAKDHPEKVQAMSDEWDVIAKRVNALRTGRPKTKKPTKKQPATTQPTKQ